MRVTSVRVRLFDKPDSKLRGFATITFDDCFMVHNIRIIDGNTGLFIAMPDRKLKDGDYVNVAHPLNNETREVITAAILAEYHTALAAEQRGESAPIDPVDDRVLRAFDRTGDATP